MINLTILLYGLLFGSFFNVVGLRVPDGKSIVKPRSACSLCGHQMTARDLVPVLSYVFLKGRCRKCGANISVIYPLTELAAALLFLYAYVLYGFSAPFWMAILLFSMLLIIVVSDAAYMLIPDKILLFFLPLFAVMRFIDPLDPWWDTLLGAAVGFVLLLLIAVVSKGGMGGGDIKLFGVLGFVLGTKLVLLTFLLACFFGAAIGLILMAAGIVKRGKPMPFGPYIALAAVAAYTHGEAMIRWYLQFF
ncbi:A24 family peptidase [Domibacillus sp. DTU_2020_1001157_1_SI_ALB_TIR_016]|uniref:prepilin peptidase n=1 Tax=Domibacillus sp. DTU_2020_1001157_1_SI_ALB_TIR_016 TaxID=3077789 RepID=UPI0028EF898B|nr:A24 family peptidase [Domibacillus sp. DTU_2020_1001157_1_SI_ALB_TIR_016]WNS81816.1 A24 family peptidase [Domibacillus sp. DTU_2020_1001157_1_SI_ALB_TIR_016]